MHSENASEIAFVACAIGNSYYSAKSFFRFAYTPEDFVFCFLVFVFGSVCLSVKKEIAGTMKFGKRLQSQIEETMPEWRPHFISYKKLKKSLKNMQLPVCIADVAFAQVTSASVDHNATSIVDAVDKELRRASEVGGRQESFLSKLSGDGVRFAGNGSAAGPKSSLGDGPLSSAVEQDRDLPGNGGSEDSTAERGPKRARREEGSTSSEADFVSLLNKELNKLNVFFIEKEEEYVIRLQVQFPVPKILFLLLFNVPVVMYYDFF